MFVTLGLAGQLPDWLVILVVFRDVLIIGGFLLASALTPPIPTTPLFISKLNTALQITLVAVVLARLGLGFGDFGATQVLIYASALTTVLSGGGYLVRWMRGPAGETRVMAGRAALFWLGALALFLAALWLLSPILLPFVAGCAIAYFLAPAVDRLDGWRVPRGLAAAFVLLVFFVALVALVLLLAPVIELEAAELARRAPAMVEAGRQQVEALLALAQQRLSPEDLAKLKDATSGLTATGDRLGRAADAAAADERPRARQSAVAHPHHAGRRVLPAARLEPDRRRDRPLAAAAPRRDHPRRGAAHRCDARGLRSRPVAGRLHRWRSITASR